MFTVAPTCVGGYWNIVTCLCNMLLLHPHAWVGIEIIHMEPHAINQMVAPTCVGGYWNWCVKAAVITMIGCTHMRGWVLKSFTSHRCVLAVAPTCVGEYWNVKEVTRILGSCTHIRGWELKFNVMSLFVIFEYDQKKHTQRGVFFITPSILINFWIFLFSHHLH